MNEWQKRVYALQDLPDELWEETHDKLRDEWFKAYTNHFIQFATARGWERENAETWPDHTRDEAFIDSYQVQYDPAVMAETDVLCIEEDGRNV